MNGQEKEAPIIKIIVAIITAVGVIFAAYITIIPELRSGNEASNVPETQAVQTANASTASALVLAEPVTATSETVMPLVEPSDTTTPTGTATSTPTITPSPTVPAATEMSASTALFKDDFEDGSTKWQPDLPVWEVRENNNNHVYCVKISGGYTYASAGATNWRDFVFEADVLVIESVPNNGSGVILVRMNENYFPTYAFSFGEVYSGFGKEFIDINGVASHTSFGRVSEGILFGQWNTLKIEVLDNHLSLFLNGSESPTLQAIDQDANVERGAIALGAGIVGQQEGEIWEVCYDNVRVTSVSE